MIYDASTPEGRNRLRALGLDLPLLADVLAFGDAERQTYTDLDARSVPEAARWSRHVRRLSERLIPLGWERIDPLNQPTLVHPDRQMSLIVASGDGYTGSPYGSPTTKNPKGESIRQAVQGNAGLTLISPQEVDSALEGLKETWIFLTNPFRGDVFSEVSLPTEMEGEFIRGWRDRILLPKWNPSDPAAFGPTSPPEEGPRYDVPVGRK